MGPENVPFDVSLAVVGAFLIIRAPRLKLSLSGTDAILHNMFRTYRIPRKLVTGVACKPTINATLCPGIEWHDPKAERNGRTVTKVSFLSLASLGHAGQSKLDAMTAIPNEWCDSQHARDARVTHTPQ